MRKNRTTITEWLLALTALASLPILVFALYTIDQLGKSTEANTVSNLERRTESLRHVIEERVQSSFGILDALATSDAAQHGDIESLYHHSLRLIAAEPEYRAISLIDPKGKMLFFTLMPLNAQLPDPSDPESARQVFDTGKPSVSSLFKSPISDRRVIALNMPVMRDGKVTYCLRLIILTDTWNRLIHDQQFPQEWVTSLVDANGILLARSHDGDRYVGKRSAPDTLKALESRLPQIFKGVRVDKIRYVNAAQPIDPWGWGVVVGVPVKTLYKPARDALYNAATVGVLLIGAAMLAAFLVARRISRQVQDVVQLSTALLNDELVAENQGQIRELVHLRESMMEFSRRHKKANRELEDASTQTADALSALEKSQNDTLTGLAGRAKFLERMQSLHAELANGSHRSLALMYIDLDNFKQVNDQFGHAAGDEVLLKAAAVFRTVVRDTDIAGRLGGDEFVIGVVGQEDDMLGSVSALADRVVESIAAIGHGIGCSIGIAVWADDCPSIDTLMQRADEAMYAAKHAGKNRHAVWAAAMHDPHPD